MRYRSRPIEIDAVLWTGDFAHIPEKWLSDGSFRFEPEGTVLIETLEGPARAKPGEHYIVRGTFGEYYPVKREIFEAKYEAVAQ